MDVKKIMNILSATAFETPSRAVVETATAAMRAVRVSRIEMVFDFDEASRLETIRLGNPGETIPLARGEGICKGWRVVVTPTTDDVRCMLALGHNTHSIIVEWDFTRAYIFPDRIPSRVCWGDWEEGDEHIDQLPESRWLDRARALVERAGLETETTGGVVSVDIEDDEAESD